MCGHVGIAGKLEHKDEATLKRLLILDYFRGPDSTGLAALRNDKTVKIAKFASNPLDAFDRGTFKDALSGYNSTIFLGHNRAATKGVVNNNNAHPYQYGHIIGAHNGTLDMSSWKALEELCGEKTDVDSQAIFACIAKVGIEETVKVLQGAWAMVWFNLEDNTLNFLRNKERPFWYAYETGFKRLFWASEWPMIRAATDLASVKYDMYTNDEGYGFFATKEDWWYRYDIDALKGGGEKPKPRVKELKGKEPAPVKTYTSGAGQYPFTYRGSGPLPGTQAGSHHTTQTSTGSGSTGQTGAASRQSTPGTSGTTTSTGSSTGTTDNVVQLIGNLNKPFGGYINKAKFDECAKHGCAWCSESVEFGDIGVTVYEATNQVLCNKCSDNGEHNRVFSHGVRIVA